MNLKQYGTKSRMMIVSLLAIGSLLMLAASPALAKGDREGPIMTTLILPRVSTDQLAQDFHRASDFYRVFRGDFTADKGLNTDFLRLLKSTDHTNKIVSADYRVYQEDILRATDVSKDLAALFSTHTGFDGDGNVTNAAQARLTLDALNADLANGLYWARHAQDTFNHSLTSHKID